MILHYNLIFHHYYLLSFILTWKCFWIILLWIFWNFCNSVNDFITNIFFDIPLLYYYFNLRSSIISCIFSGGLYLSLGIFLSFSFTLSSSEFFCCKFFENFEILLAMLLPIKSAVASAFFLNYYFWSSFKCICCRLFGIIKKFLTIFTIYVFTFFLSIFLPIFLANHKNP